MMIPLIHLGMNHCRRAVLDPKGMLHTEGRGGSPYGASTMRDRRVSLLRSRKTWPSAVSRANESLNSRKKSAVKRRCAVVCDSRVPRAGWIRPLVREADGEAKCMQSTSSSSSVTQCSSTAVRPHRHPV